jgi:hypothetical protein
MILLGVVEASTLLGWLLVVGTKMAADSLGHAELV